MFNHHSSYISYSKCQVFSACFSFSDLLSHILYLKVNPCLIKKPFCIQARCIWDLNAFAFSPVFIFCFVSLLCLINTFPSEEAKHSLCSLPLAADSDSRGWAWGKERQSLYITTKIIPSPWHVRQLQREFDIWANWVAKVILIYLAVGTEGMGLSRTFRGESESGVSGHTLQMKKKWFTNSSERTESKVPEPACPSPWPGL